MKNSSLTSLCTKNVIYEVLAFNLSGIDDPRLAQSIGQVDQLSLCLFKLMDIRKIAFKTNISKNA